MVEWYWLLIELIVLMLFGAGLRGATRTRALANALNDPPAAREELIRRLKMRNKYGMYVTNVDERIRIIR